MEKFFLNKRVLVTGAGKGIGRAIATRLYELGAEVVAISRTQSDLDTLREEMPNMQTLLLDVGDWDNTRQTVEPLGQFDMLVNNAGFGAIKPFLETSKFDLDSVFDVNFKAAYNLAQIVAKGMVDRKSGGAIVNVSSVFGKAPFLGVAPYATSKAALDMLTMMLAKELGPYKIRTNSINPGFVKTPATEEFFSQPGVVEDIIAGIPMGRIVEKKDVVDTVVYLLSEQAAMVNGARLTVDGGQYLP